MLDTFVAPVPLSMFGSQFEDWASEDVPTTMSPMDIHPSGHLSSSSKSSPSPANHNTNSASNIYNIDNKQDVKYKVLRCGDFSEASLTEVLRRKLLQELPSTSCWHANDPSSEKSSSERKSTDAQIREKNAVALRFYRESKRYFEGLNRSNRRSAEFYGGLSPYRYCTTPSPEAISDEFKSQADPKRIPAVLSEPRFSWGLNSLETQRPPLVRFVLSSSRPNQTSGHTGAFASPASTGLDNPFKPLDTFERQQIHPDVEEYAERLRRLRSFYGHRTMEHDPVSLKRDFPILETPLSYNQTQVPEITSAGRHALGFEAFDDTSPLSLNGFRPDQHANRETSRPVRGWSASTGPPSVYSRPSSSLKATSTRTSRTPQHRQYLDVWFYRRCPESRIDALNMAIQFRDAYGANQPIPDELIDDHLEENADGKFIFWGDKARKARNKTGARDHVRKLLGNFPFCCSNLGCEHSSLRRADLNKHKKSCKFPSPPSFPPNVSWEVQNLGFPAPNLSASAGLMPQEQHTTVDTDALLDITNAGEDIMDSYLTFFPLGGEYEAGIDGAE